MTAFKPGRFYRHLSTLDIDIHVLGVTSSEDTLCVRYFNRHYKIYQGEVEYIQTPKDVSLWTEVVHKNH